MNQSILNISWGTIFKIFVAVILMYIIYAIRDIIVWFVFALMISILFNFAVDFFEKKRIPRIVSATFLYLAVFALLSFFIYETAPVLLSEFKDFAKNFPNYLNKISPIFERFGVESFRTTESLVQAVQDSLEAASGGILSALFSIFGSASASILVIIMAFFISIEKRFIEKILRAFTPPGKKDYVFSLWESAKKKVSGWFITRIIGVLFVGFATFLVLTILNVKYALLLAVFAGVLDFLPIAGPIVAGFFLTVMVALASPWQGLFVLIAFIIIQQLENNLIFPLLFKKFIGISPVIVLLALSIGGILWGITGAILAIPLAGVLFEVLKDYLLKLRKARTQEA